MRKDPEYIALRTILRIVRIKKVIYQSQKKARPGMLTCRWRVEIWLLPKTCQVFHSQTRDIISGHCITLTVFIIISSFIAALLIVLNFGCQLRAESHM